MCRVRPQATGKGEPPDQAHPLNSEQSRRARALTREMSGEGRDAVTAALREQGLPAIGTQMRMMLFGLTSLARLNSRRARLEETIAQADGRG